MNTVDQLFHARVSRIPRYGLGLSVDVYSPNLFQLIETLTREGLICDYLEVFKATEGIMARIREEWPGFPLAYHAEGLWVTQPNLKENFPLHLGIAETVAHLDALQSPWLTQECASKQIVGYSFGTYLPPLFTKSSAEVTAQNVAYVQSQLDQLCSFNDETGPLFLLETPPLTYFAFGDLPYAKFFQEVVQAVPCGLVLDIGHVWTVYRYTEYWEGRSLEAFLDNFLSWFPLERVVQIHVAGLGIHESLCVSEMRDSLPPWIDSHGAPIPWVSFDMLRKILENPRLRNLKGIALEVDTKEPFLIQQEFREFRDSFGSWANLSLSNSNENEVDIFKKESGENSIAWKNEKEDLSAQYEQYVSVVTGQAPCGSLPFLGRESERFLDGLAYYRKRYLPYEILEWGGGLRELFPKTCPLLLERGCNLEEFVDFWFKNPRRSQTIYDYFHVKLDYFLRFVEHRVPLALDVARQEADELRDAYANANDL